MDEKYISIYLHWPFCLSKCPYCDFVSAPVQRNDLLFEEYADLLLRDLKKSLEDVECELRAKTVFFGGGTPSLMPPKSIEKILRFLRDKAKLDSDAEISLEANPATFELQKMQAFKNAGVNRISLGVQSFLDANLKFLGRIYGSSQAFRSAEIVTKVFDNFSFDFMYGYEPQNINSFEKDLRIAADHFACKHISCYQLTFEKSTPFYKRLLSGNIHPFSENKEIQFYKFAENFLKQYKLRRYEVSNYAKNGFECRHNLACWNYFDYIGVGSAAHGRISIKGNKCATEKIRDTFEWANAVKKSENTYSTFSNLNDEEILQEMLIMKLRLLKGLDLHDIYDNVAQNVVNKVITEPKLRFLQRHNLIKIKDAGKIALTEAGMMKMNSVIEFLCA